MVSLVGPCQEMGSHSDVETLRDGILLRPHVLGRIHQMPHLSNHQNVLLTMCFRYVLTMVSRPGPKIEIWIRMGVANQRSYRTTNGNFEHKKSYIFIECTSPNCPPAPWSRWTLEAYVGPTWLLGSGSSFSLCPPHGNFGSSKQL